MRVATFRALLTLSAALLGSGALLARGRALPPPVAGNAFASPSHVGPASGLGESAIGFVARRPFRLVREATIEPPTEPDQRTPGAGARIPAFRLSGVLGPPWHALIQEGGITGATTVVRAGDRIGDVSIDSVTPFRVWLRSADSAWSILLEVPWQ